MLVTVYKCLHGAAPSNLLTYLQVRMAGSYILSQGYAKLKPPAFRTTTFVLHSFRHLASSVWNKLPDTSRKLILFLCLLTNSNNLTNRPSLCLFALLLFKIMN